MLNKEDAQARDFDDFCLSQKTQLFNIINSYQAFFKPVIILYISSKISGFFENQDFCDAQKTEALINLIKTETKDNKLYQIISYQINAVRSRFLLSQIQPLQHKLPLSCEALNISPQCGFQETVKKTLTIQPYNQSEEQKQTQFILDFIERMGCLINGVKYFDWREIQQISFYPIIQKYIFFHSQKVFTMFNNILTHSIKQKLACNIICNIIFEWQINLITNVKNYDQEHFALIFTAHSFLLQLTSKETKIFFVPGAIFAKFEPTKDKKGLELVSFEASNSVLKAFLNNALPEKIRIEQLSEQAAAAETDEDLYQSYKKQISQFLYEDNANFYWGKLYYKDKTFFIRFFEEVDIFLAKYFIGKEQDIELANNCTKIRNLIYVSDTLLGNHHQDPNGNKNRFNKNIIVSLINKDGIYTPIEKLDFLEKIFKQIKENTQNLYVYNGRFSQFFNENVLTSTQQKHISILKNIYIEIVQENIKNPDVKAKLQIKDGLVDFNSSNMLKWFKSSKTRTRRIIENIQYCETHPQPQLWLYKAR